MKSRIAFAVFTLFLAIKGFSAEPVAEQFLRYIYGADVDGTKFCLPAEDLWMLSGPKDTNALQFVAALKLDAKKQNGILSGVVRHRDRQDLYFVEMRDGKVDPVINLDGAGQRNRNEHRCDDGRMRQCARPSDSAEELMEHGRAELSSARRTMVRSLPRRGKDTAALPFTIGATSCRIDALTKWSDASSTQSSRLWILYLLDMIWQNSRPARGVDIRRADTNTVPQTNR